jgi:hypothetical protein
MYVMKANIIVNNILICTITVNTWGRWSNVLNSSVFYRSGKRRAEIKLELHFKNLVWKLKTSLTTVTTSFKGKQQFHYMKHSRVLAKVAYKKKHFTYKQCRQRTMK